MDGVKIFFDFFGLAFSALLPLINPLGSALIFVAMIGYARAAPFRELARKIAVNTTLLLVFVQLAGTGVLAFFGISLAVMKVAGGLVLASMGWRLLNQVEVKTHPAVEDATKDASRSLEQMVFYPFTFPVTAGPGCIVVMLTLSAHASARQALMSAVAHLGIFAAVVILSLLVFICYRYAPKIQDRISPQNAQGILRVTAFVLLCIGVQITWNGTASMLEQILKR